MFKGLLAKVKPLIARRDTILREAISPAERLAVTLCFLATGKMWIILEIEVSKHISKSIYSRINIQLYL